MIGEPFFLPTASKLANFQKCTAMQVWHRVQWRTRCPTCMLLPLLITWPLILDSNPQELTTTSKSAPTTSLTSATQRKQVLPLTSLSPSAPYAENLLPRSTSKKRLRLDHQCHVGGKRPSKGKIRANCTFVGVDQRTSMAEFRLMFQESAIRT